MKTIHVANAVLLTSLLLATAGCANVLFNRATLSRTRTTTIGQELVDLQTAKEKGLVSEEEFNTLRKRLLEDDYHEIDELTHKH